MTEEINPSELGAFTNNLPNKEGIKKLIKAVEDNTSDIATKQDKLTAGSNVAISDQNVISATDTKYTAGTNVEISDQNVISAIDTKYTAGTGISISEQNVISASGDSSNDWTEVDISTKSKFGTAMQTYKNTHDILIYFKSLSDNLYAINILGTKTNINRSEFTIIGGTTSRSATSLFIRYYINSLTLYYTSNQPTGGSASKYYDCDGNDITSSNIANYIDASDGYKCIKPFYVDYSIVKPGDTKLRYLCGITSGAFMHTVNKNLSDVYDAIVNSTTLSIGYGDMMFGTQEADYNTSKMYVRPSSIHVVTPTP